MEVLTYVQLRAKEVFGSHWKAKRSQIGDYKKMDSSAPAFFSRKIMPAEMEAHPAGSRRSFFR